MIWDASEKRVQYLGHTAAADGIQVSRRAQIASGVGKAAVVQQRAVLGDARILFGGARLRGELEQVPVAAELCTRAALVDAGSRWHTQTASEEGNENTFIDIFL